MNYIKHLTGFFDRVAKDKLLNPTHVSLYIALFQFWNCNRFRNPISISRDEVMRISKISSKATYHKCMKALHALGYIDYQPSYNPFKGSHVILFNFADELKPALKSEKTPGIIFSPVVEQVVNKSCTTTETGSEQALVPFINNINNPNTLNSSNAGEPEKKYPIVSNDLETLPGKEKEKGSAQKEKEKKTFVFGDSDENHFERHLQEPSLPEKEKLPSLTFVNYAASENTKRTAASSEVETSPQLNQVIAFFQDNDFPILEAQKFFNYFQSVGWLVGGRSPMTNWPAAARNWMLNAPKFTAQESNNRTTTLNIATEKDYAEPL